MKDDLRGLNRKEERVQKELMIIHKQSLPMHDAVIQKNNIDTTIQTSEEMFRKIVNAPAEKQEVNFINKNKQLLRPGAMD